ncbi:MAG TPA: DUF2066 domain-containing protein [Stellaceae bacterium]|nr:DUF2066 domain-containing protein [Stellaceae bacterium]
MTLLPLARGIGKRSRRLVAGVLMLLAVAAAARVAAAQDDPFSATVPVDATSDTVAKARDLARIDGQRRALSAIVDRLAGGPGKAKPPKLGDNQITDLVASFEVANEKMSAVRYMADYTFHFRPAELKKTLQAAGIAITEPGAGGTGVATADTGAKPIVVLPVYQNGASTVLWEDPNPWRQAWAERPAAGGAAKLMLPMGDVDDIGAIDADKARAGDSAALAAIAGKYKADEALLLLAVQRPAPDPSADKLGGLDVMVRRYKLGQPADVHSDSIDPNPGESAEAFFARAAARIATDIDTGWKNVKEPPVDQQGSLVAVLPISGLDDWVKLRERVAAVPAVRKVEVKSLSRQEATIEIQYVGTLDQLKAGFAEIKLDLEGGDPIWRIARSGADRSGDKR